MNYKSHNALWTIIVRSDDKLDKKKKKKKKLKIT